VGFVGRSGTAPLGPRALGRYSIPIPVRKVIVKVNPMLLEKGMYLYPAFEAKHLANGGLRKPLTAITFQRQRLKRLWLVWLFQ
jgi:hypothetical protein